MLKQLIKKMRYKHHKYSSNGQMPPKLILIVGCYNCGTTLLNYILSQHQEISGLGTEGVALTKEFRTPEEFGWNRLWYKCREQIEICRLKHKPDVKKIRHDWSKHFDATKPYAMEKSIVHGLNIDWFEKEFAHPYFIWIIRNGYAVAEGIRRRTQFRQKNNFASGEPYPIEWCAEQWVQSNKVIEQKLQQVRHSYFLRYEDLVDKPDLTIQTLLNWLPVKSRELKVPHSFTFHKQTLPISNQNKKALQKLSTDDLNKINEIAEGSIQHYGYKILDNEK